MCSAREESCHCQFFHRPISILNNQQFQRALFDPVQFPSGASWKAFVSTTPHKHLKSRNITTGSPCISRILREMKIRKLQG